MTRPGPRNLITDVPGLQVGNAEDTNARTGVTVILPDAPAVAAVDARGGGTGTRDVAALAPEGTVRTIDALVLSGGSAFGLDAAGAVMNWLAARGVGFPVADARVPIVPQAILFDLANGGDKEWDGQPPYPDLARAACEAAGKEFRLGNIGAGLGAIAGPLKGGLGSASILEAESGAMIGALAAANPVGSVLIPGTNAFNAWNVEIDGEYGGVSPPTEFARGRIDTKTAADPGASTTLVTVATDARLDRLDLQRVAIMAQDGLARAIRPVHTPLDGDIVFALSTGKREIEVTPRALLRLGTLAADCVARAISRGVYHANSLGSLCGYRDALGG